MLVNVLFYATKVTFSSSGGGVRPYSRIDPIR